MISTLENLAFSKDFFEAEVREGFYVSDIMKRYWASQLKVLSEIDKVCRRHDIPWFADCGTLLGAVRHGGYIPWDDDLDILMLRHDYRRFFEYAKAELPKEYRILTIQEDEDYYLRTGRVVNGHEISFESSYLKDHFGCPYNAGIDIFPLDGLSEDPTYEDERCRYASLVDKAMILFAGGDPDTEESRALLLEIEKSCHVKIDRKNNIFRQLRFVLEDVYSSTSSKDAANLALMVFWTEKRSHKYPKKLFEDRVYLPFEGLLMPVPCCYEQVLRIEYGDYMAIHRGGGIHDYPLFSAQEDIVEERLGRNPVRYRIKPDMFPLKEKEASVKQTCSRIIGLLEKAENQISLLIEGCNLTEGRKLLEGCQSMAISMGNALEKEKKSKKCVVSVEDFCEAVFICYDQFDVRSLQELIIKRKAMQKSIDEFFQSRKKEILFLPCKKKWWDESMGTVFNRMSKDEDLRLVVMPVPYYEFSQDGSKTADLKDESDAFDRSLPLVSVHEYRPDIKRPDMIVTQYPYDGWNQAMSLPNFFYSDNLRQYTDKLVYLPCFEPEDPEQGDEKAVAAIRMLAEQPAVVNADEIWLISDKMKSIYVDYLTECSGEKYRDYWESKFIVMKSKENKSKENTALERSVVDDSWEACKGGRKLLVYHVAISSLLSNGEKGLDKIRDSFRTISSNTDNIFCVFSLHTNVGELEKIAPRLWEELQSLITEFREIFVKENKGLLDLNYEAAEHIHAIDAYYGDGGHLAHLCRREHKPVMIRQGA